MYSMTEKIIKYTEKKGQVTPHELVREMEIGATMVHRHLKKLTESGVLEKLGKPPRVFYRIKQQSEIITETIHNSEYAVSINEYFTLVTPDGNEIEGVSGFVLWCKQRNFDAQKKAQEYYETLRQYSRLYNNGIIDATVKIKQTFSKDKQFLDRLYFLYPYSLPVFGKTKIATWLFHGKQTENVELMKKVFDKVIPKIQNCIQQGNYDAIGFIPPSVPRSIQFMKELQKKLLIKIPVIKIEKIKNAIIIQQKSLKDIRDRIKNAENTLVVTEKQTYKKILLIDDFTGSGSTLNVVAEKIKKQSLGKEIHGLTITGSMNGFEIIKEV